MKLLENEFHQRARSENPRPRGEKLEGRIVCFSNVYDDHYLSLRQESIPASLSAQKRRDLYHCLEAASGRELFLLSSPPKALDRRRGRWLPARATQFSSHPQFFCANLDLPKLRVPASWLSYAAQALSFCHSGDIILLDNYELLYVLAAYAARLRHELTFLLEYEDGKHLIDTGWPRLFSRAAEEFGRPLLKGAILATPTLAERLPSHLPYECVPGFYRPVNNQSPPPRTETLTFLYSGTLDHARGVDLLLEALSLLPKEGWELHITGSGPLEDHVAAAAKAFPSRVSYHGVLAASDYNRLLRRCHVSLNCQRANDPIGSVTFPSKLFTYLSAGLAVISSRASGVPQIIGEAATYYAEDTPRALATEMEKAIKGLGIVTPRVALERLCAAYSIEGTTARLRPFFRQLLSSDGS